MRKLSRLASLALLLSATSLLPAASKDLGNGFLDHGVASPISNHRGTVATVDGQGHNVLLVWLMDHRGGYALLVADATTGKVDEYPVPFKFTEFDAPYASILSSANKFYTHQNSHFIEFDPAKRAFTFSKKTFPQMAMSMTEDDNGVIWSTTYPDGGLVSFDPKTKAFRDYGSVYKENWQLYNRSIAADDQGWIYFAVGNTNSQIVIVDPKTGKSTPVLPPEERKKGVAYLYRDLDGKVYGRASTEEKEGPWYELYQGKATKIAKHENVREKKFISGSQALSLTTFKDGSSGNVDLVTRKFTVTSKSGEKKEYPFDYSSDGAIVMGVSACPDGTAAGGTAFPMRCFQYDPKSDTLDNRAAYMQWNTAQRQGDHFFVFGYPGGFLLDWDPAKPWVPTVKGKPSNPDYLLACTPVIHRPTKLLALPDNRHLVCAGTPDYGYTGGGLLFFDRNDNSHTLLKDTDLVPDQSTLSMVPLGNGKILAGTTTQPGTGGERKAREARLYLLDHDSRKIEWQEAVFPGVQEYTDLSPAPNGLVYGFADSHLFFVFDPATHKVVHQFDTDKQFGRTVHEQGPRVFVRAADKDTPYVLFSKGIAQITPATHALTWVAKSPVKIDAGGDVVADRLYFIHESHVCSYKLK